MAKQANRWNGVAGNEGLQRAIQHRLRGEYRKAEIGLLKSLESIETVAAPPGPEHLSIWNELGMVYKYLGEFRKADRYYRLALRQTQLCLVGREREFFLANLYHNLGGLEHSRRHFRRGERYARISLQLRIRTAGAGSLAVATDRAALAANLDGLGKFAESEKLYRQALRTYHRVYGATHPEIAVVLNNLAALYQATGRPKRAEALYHKALEMKRRELGASHPDLAVTLNNLAMLCRSQGKKNAARQGFKSALRILNSSLGSSHPNAHAVRNNLQRLSPH
jgi:tetratricopeptide (TPR) repeat protein